MPCHVLEPCRAYLLRSLCYTVSSATRRVQKLLVSLTWATPSSFFIHLRHFLNCSLQLTQVMTPSTNMTPSFCPSTPRPSHLPIASLALSIDLSRQRKIPRIVVLIIAILSLMGALCLIALIFGRRFGIGVWAFFADLRVMWEDSTPPLASPPRGPSQLCLASSGRLISDGTLRWLSSWNSLW